MTTPQPRRRNGQYDRVPAPAPTTTTVPSPTTATGDVAGVPVQLADVRAGLAPDPQLAYWEAHAWVDQLVQAVWTATPVDQAYLSRSRQHRVRAAVAKVTTDPAVQARLATDPDASVRETLASNTHLGPAVLDVLAASRSSTCLSRVIAHPHTSVATLEKLAAHRLPAVHEPARRRLATRAA